MPINWRPVTTLNPNLTFNQALWELLKGLEAPTQAERLNLTVVDGNLTIGVGFDLIAGGQVVRIGVYKGMGLDGDLLKPRKPNAPALTTQQQTELGYLQQLETAIAAGNQAQIHQIMSTRAADNSLNGYRNNRRSTFTFASDPEVNAVLDDLWAGFYRKQIFATYPFLSADTAAHTSREMLTFASLIWNGGTALLGSRLGKALGPVQSSRAEAWFEIRYGSNVVAMTYAKSGVSAMTPKQLGQFNSGIDKGLAKRRFFESAMFGLYDDPQNVGLSEAKSVYQMLNAHRLDILRYESHYGDDAHGTTPDRLNQVSEAQTDYSSIPLTAAIQLLSNALNPARDAVLVDLQTRYPAQQDLFDGPVFPLSTDLYIAPASGGVLDALPVEKLGGNFAAGSNDLMVGSETVGTVMRGRKGTDTLVGGSGEDTLDGGEGADTLIGGTGTDTYIWNRGDGNDTIIDSDGIRLIVNGNTYGFSNTTLVKDALSNTWRDSTGNVVLQHNTEWQLVMDDGSTITLGGTFDPAQAGITLLDPPTAGSSIAVRYTDPQGGPVDVWRPPGWPFGPLNSISFTGTNANELIFGGDSQDASGTLGDSIDGGAGHDFILGGRGRDVLKGGDGNDYIRGSLNGNYQHGFNSGLGLPMLLTANGWGLFDAGGGGAYFPLHWTYIGFGTSYTSADDGNTIDGGNGNDDIDSGGNIDIVHGGADDDSIRGGGQGDTLYGDGGVDTIYGDGFDDGSTAIEVTTLAEHGNDFIDGGSGNDRLVGQGGDDVLFGNLNDDTLYGDADSLGFPTASNGSDVLDGGGGNDILDGGGKADILLGGSEDDELYGDGDVERVAAEDHGNDLLDGEEGNDVLVGNGGIDTLSGGEGNDRLFGDAADVPVEFQLGDVLDGGEGDDELYGDGGNDRLLGGEGGDILSGGTGNDTLLGGEQSDYLFGDEGEDHLFGGEGVDFLSGGAEIDQLMGEEGDDFLFGDGGNDLLNGGEGADYLSGGADNDTYVVDNAADFVAEATGGGTDVILASITTALGANIENLTLTGDDNVSAFGNSLDNVLAGNLGANVLDGGGGNDTYVVDDANDVVQEIGGSGTDLVQSSVDFVLASGIENLTLTGNAEVFGQGNSLANILTGNSAANLLVGEGGDDTYIVGAGDEVLETADAGTDLVQSSVSFTLGDHIENLTLTGSDAINGTGNALANTLTGNSGANVLTGGAGDDIYVVGAGDSVIENADEGIDLVQSSVTWTLGANQENLTLTGSGAINGTGNALDNILLGNSGVNTLTGGAGNDTYQINSASDVLIENAGEGIDTVRSSVTHTLAANFEHLTLTGGSTIHATGNAVDNILIGNTANNTLTAHGGNDTLDGGTGNDTMVGGTGNDTYYVSATADVITELSGEGTDVVFAAATYVLSNNVENLTLTGEAVINGTGNGADNVITGNTANNVLDGAGGADTLAGGAGNDTYVVDATDLVIEGADQGIDLVQTGVSYTLGDNLENLTLTGTSGVNGIGNALANVLTGNNGANTLTGGDGNDTYVVGEAGDTVVELANQGVDLVQSTISYALANNVENLTLTGAGATTATGNSLDNVLLGNSAANSLLGGDGNDTLDGGADVDQLAGGAGDDRYIVTSGADLITENAGEGIDTVEASITFVLAANVEHLTLTGSAAINGTGNALDNTLTGNNGVNILTGGAGNDTYLLSNSSDSVVEAANEGIDLVSVDATYTLAANVENLEITGTLTFSGTGNALDNTITGNSANNTLTGLGGNDYLDGAAGIDTMVGGQGDDTYVVDTYIVNPTTGEVTRDVITEAAGEGTDLARSSVTYALAANVENLTLIGSANIDGFGNGLANTLTGNAGNNRLDAWIGNDTLIGGAGDDIYVVDEAADVVIENASEGTDTVEAEISYTIGSNVENLTLIGTADINGTGNSMSNTIVGNSGVNTLIGGLGDDTYTVHSKDLFYWWEDSYELRNFLDTVIEDAGEGYDTIIATDCYSAILPDNVERLIIYYNFPNHAWSFNVTQDVRRKFIGNELDNVIDATLADEASIGLGHVHFPGGFDLGEIVIDGGGGADQMFGSNVTTRFVVDNVNDVVVAGTSNGDMVQSSVTYTLVASVEHIELTGSAAISATGNSGNNRLDGSKNTGANALAGGMGNDRYLLGAGDSVVESAGEGTDTVVLIGGAVRTYLTSEFANTENLELGATMGASNLTGDGLANVLVGNTAANALTGGGGSDTLDGGAGTDALAGGQGDDLYILNDADTITEASGEGIDHVQSSITYTLAANVENLTLTGASAINGTGNALDNVLTGNDLTNTLTGGAGNDTYVVQNATDVIVENAGEGTDLVQTVWLGSYTLGANLENLTVTGNATAIGNALANVLTGGVASNLLDGAGGNDTMIGGEGDDTYVVESASDVVVENANEGTDVVQSSLTYVLGAHVENLTLTGASSINGTGNALDNVLAGNSAANTLTGGAGNDTYVVDHVGDSVVEFAGEGSDTVQSSISYTLGQHLENLTLIGSASVNATGNSGDNLITGNAGTNTLAGGLGNDTYVVNNVEDIVVENANEGTDTIQASVTYTASADVEHVTLTGTSAINATGNSLANDLTGNSGANVLNGGGGADRMYGLAGNDTYIIDHVDDQVFENSGAGVDTIVTPFSRVLVSFFENLTLSGTDSVNATGNSFGNVLTGNSGNNVLDGAGGSDSMLGGAGDDTYYVDNSDTVTENLNEGTDLVVVGQTYTLTANVENLRLTGTTAMDGTGNALANELTGNSSTNILDGGAGADVMLGGGGVDTYVVDNIGDTIIENANEGSDRVNASVSYTLSINVENLTLTGAAAINGTGNADVNSIVGNGADNILNGGLGADSLDGNAGNDTYVVDNTGDTVSESASEGTDIILSSVSYTISSNVENLTLTGSANVNATGNTLANIITGNAGNNTLNGGTGADTLTGGLGNDLYVVDNVSDVVTESADQGIDSVQTGLSYTLGAHLENLTLTGSSVLGGVGNSLDNVITGNTGASTLTGGTGNDTYVLGAATNLVVENAGEGIDVVQSGFTFTLASHVENLTLTGSGAINGTGNDLDNVLVGNSGANVLNGGLGADAMSGGTGNDTYVIESAGDLVAESASGGTDIVQSSISYTLTSDVEQLVLTGTSSINGTGNGLANSLTGNSGDNTLDGGAANDTMIGGAGNDTYIVDSTSDVTTEAAAGGTDLVLSSATFTLAAEVENLTLTGAAAVNGTGNGLVNILTGNEAANTLSGAGGADTMIGGAGNDTYVVENAGDTIVEANAEGTDLVQSSVTYTLSSNVENLTLTGSSTLNATGNALANTLTGNSGANILDGAGGIDTLIGGSGNDTYVVDDTGDVVTEASGTGTGTDTVQSSASYTLAANVEHLTLTGSASINATGNSGGNTLTGNSGNNVLDGTTGTDTMIGGAGDDIYYADVAADVTTEVAAEGIDQVNSGATRTLSANIELLFLTGSANNGGTGNTLANLIRGNTGNNALVGGQGTDILEGDAGTDTLSNASGSNSLMNGGAGTDTITGTASNDLLIGGTGNDTLNSGTGADLIAFNKGDGHDTLAVSTTNDNTVTIGGGALYADLLFEKSGNHLILKVGGSDQLTLTDYYANPANRSVDKLQIIIEGTSDYDSGSGDATRNQKIQSFDFDGLVAAFDAARALDPGLTSWALTNALTAQHLGASDTAALGGDLAYQYARFGNLGGISFMPALGILSAGTFGSSAQTLQSSGSLQDSSARLS